MFLEALPTEVRNLLTPLGRESDFEPFYLAGGSAVALHLGHRVSIDLDFFTPRRTFVAEALAQSLARLGRVEIDQQDRRTMLGRLNDVKFSFLVYPYPLLEEVARVEGVRVAGLLDLALMKLIAVGQRGTRRDFVDLYFLCQHGLELRSLLAKVPEKFREIEYPSYHLLKSLVFFDDAEEDEPPHMLHDVDWQQVKKFFREEVRSLHGSP